MGALHGGASCCELPGCPQHVEESVKKGKALMIGLEPPEEQMAAAIRVGAVGTVKQESEVCDKWRKYKGVGSIYYIDQKQRRSTPDEQELSGSVGASTGTTAAPTPTSFEECLSEFEFDRMD